MKCFFLVIYREDIDIDMLDTELKTWLGYKLKFNLNDIQSIHTHFTEKNLKLVFPNIFVLLLIFLTVPVTSVENERSFSVLKRLKSWLRTTMGQVRLSSLAIIQINPSELLKLNISDIVDIFSSTKNRRVDFF